MKWFPTKFKREFDINDNCHDDDFISIILRLTELLAYTRTYYVHGIVENLISFHEHIHRGRECEREKESENDTGDEI